MGKRYEIAYKLLTDGSGYGTFRRGIERGLEGLGYSWEYVPLKGFTERLQPRSARDVLYRNKGHKYKAWVDERYIPYAVDLADSGPVTRPGVCRLCLDIPDRWAWDGAGRRVGFTMFETDALPVLGQYSWLPYLRGADTVIVPSAHNVDLFSPYCKRVVGIPLAVDVDRFPYYDRTSRIEDIRAGRRPFIFLLAGELNYRKGYDIALEAMGRVFAGRQDVWLVLKTRGLSPFMERRKPDKRQPAHGSPWLWEADRAGAPNVYLMRGELSPERMRRLYELADCFIWPSRGEGYGLPPREAAATGLPVLCPAHTGMPDAADWSYVIRHTQGGPAHYAYWGQVGRYQEPSVEHTAELMQRVYTDYAEALAFGRQAAERVRQRTWADVARELDAVLQEGE